MKVIAIVPKKSDYLVSAIIEGLFKNKVEIIGTEKSNNIKKAYSKKEIIRHSKDVKYILVFNGKVIGNLPPKYFLLDKINKPHITAFVDGSEWDFSFLPKKNQIIESLKDSGRRKGEKWINQTMFNYCNWYFKRECYHEDAKKGIIPLIFAAEEKYFGNYDCKKVIDVFCSFGQNMTGLRKGVEKICIKLKTEGYKIIIQNNLPYDKYLKLISSSYINIDAWGAGDCTARFWEILANKSCCFAQKYNILFPNEFTDGVNYVEYSSIKEFETKLRYYLENKQKCIEIAERGYQHLLKYHTTEARAKYLINILERDNKIKGKFDKKKFNAGKMTYLNILLNSFKRSPKNVLIYLKNVIEASILRIKNLRED